MNRSGVKTGLRTIFLLTAFIAAGCTPSEVVTAPATEQQFVHRVRAEGNLAAVHSTAIGVPSQVRRRVRVSWMAPDGIRVDEGDVVLRFDQRDMQRNLENARGDLTKSGHESTKTAAESDTLLRDLDNKKELAELELSVSTRYQFEDDQVFSRNEIIESRIDGELAQTRKDHATEVGDIRQELRRSDGELVDISKRLAERKISEAQEALAALEVRAPHPGLLTWTRDWTGEPVKVGVEVWRGRELGTLPRLDEMNALVHVLEADAGGIEVGQLAVLTVESRPEVPIEATVSAVEPVSQQPFRGSPVRYFGVTLTPTATDPSFMKPGQRVSALIYVENRERALVVPRQAVIREQGKAYVYKQSGSQFERTEIQLGPRSISLAVVEAGLQVGDVVALEDPTALIDQSGLNQSDDTRPLGAVEQPASVTAQ